MEAVLRLDQSMEVELQGWLLKRGAGYNDENEEVDASKAFFPISKLDSLLFGKNNKSRYFVLVKSDKMMGSIHTPSVTLYYYAKPPKIVKERAHEEIKQPAGSRAYGSKLGAKPFQAPVNAYQKRGQIEISDTSTIVLKDGVIKLVCTGRTYYFRSPEDKKTEAEKSYTVGQWFEGIRKLITWLQSCKIRASTQITANADHLKRLSTAFARQSLMVNSQTLMHRKSSIGFNNLEDNIPSSLQEILAEPFYRKEFKDYLGYAHATENLDFYDKVTEYRQQAERLLAISKLKSAQRDIESFAKSIVAEFINEDAPRQVNISSDQRKQVIEIVKAGKSITSNIFNEAQHEVYLLMETNFFQRFYRDLLKRTGCFATLFHQFSLPGYHAIVQNHFGSVMAESERLLTLYKGKLEAVDKQTEVIRNSLKASHEVAVPEFRTLRYALYATYSSSVKRLEALDIFRTELIENGVNKLETLIQTLKKELSDILAKDKAKISAYKQLDDDHKLLAEVERAIQMHIRMVEQNAETLESANDNLAKYRIKLVPEKFQEELQQAKMNTETAQRKEREAYKDLADDLSDSLNDLEKLDLHRLGEQQAVMANMLVAESDLFTSLTLNIGAGRSRVEKLDVNKDIERLTMSLNTKLTEEIFQTQL